MKHERDLIREIRRAVREGRLQEPFRAEASSWQSGWRQRALRPRCSRGIPIEGILRLKPASGISQAVWRAGV